MTNEQTVRELLENDLNYYIKSFEDYDSISIKEYYNKYIGNIDDFIENEGYTREDIKNLDFQNLPMDLEEAIKDNIKELIGSTLSVTSEDNEITGDRELKLLLTAGGPYIELELNLSKETAKIIGSWTDEKIEKDLTHVFDTLTRLF